MIKIHRVLICNQTSQGLFGKINLEGYIPLNRIKLSSTPYNLELYLILEVEAYSKELQNKRLSIHFEMYNLENHKLGDAIIDCGSVPEIEFEIPLFTFPVQLYIPEYGTLKLTVIVEGSPVFEDLFKIEPGDSANFNLTKPLESSGILSKDKMGFSLAPFIGKASQEIVFVDLYLKPDFLLEIIPLVPAVTNVKILTGEEQKKEYIKEISKTRAISNSVEIRFSRNKSDKRGFHDRFIIINWIEYFQFGHSLKDLLRGKVSRRSKMVDKKEIDDFKKHFDSEWHSAEAL